MGQIFYHSKISDFRRQLRSNMTPAETVLWNHLKGRQLMGLKFRRQASIGNYIADFYCPEAKLVLEVDGDIHLTEQVQEHDKERDIYLQSLGLIVIRVTNVDVMGNIEGVGKTIVDAVSGFGSLPLAREG